MGSNLINGMYAMLDNTFIFFNLKNEKYLRRKLKENKAELAFKTQVIQARGSR